MLLLRHHEGFKMKHQIITYFAVLIGIGGGGISIAESAVDLKVGLSSAPQNLDPRYGMDLYSWNLQELLFDSLVTFKPNMEWEPALASEIKYLDDRTLRVTLKPGAKFSNG